MLVRKSAAGREEDYVYDADGERIGARNPYAVSGDSWTWSIRDIDNHVLREFQSSNTSRSLPWSWVEDYVYRDGLLLATDRVVELGGRRDMHLDHLGTPRLMTDSKGNIVVDRELRPFGSHTTTAAVTQDTSHGFDREEPMAFTGHERDYTSDPTMYTDYMHGREYTPQWGRFLSVDPIVGNPAFPQSWNRYSYALNRRSYMWTATGLSRIAFGKAHRTTGVTGSAPTPLTSTPRTLGLGVVPVEQGRAELQQQRLPLQLANLLTSNVRNPVISCDSSVHTVNSARVLSLSRAQTPGVTKPP